VFESVRWFDAMPEGGGTAVIRVVLWSNNRCISCHGQMPARGPALLASFSYSSVVGLLIQSIRSTAVVGVGLLEPLPCGHARFSHARGQGWTHPETASHTCM